MKKIKFKKSGICVSVIGFGGIPIQRISHKEASVVLNTALDEGITFYDTARGYTDSEEKIGRAFKNRRQEVVIASKAMSRDRQRMTREIEASLKNLKTDVIDLYQLHGIATQEQLKRATGPGGAFEAIQTAIKDGKIRSVGVTGHIRGMLKTALETDLFDTVQVPVNPIEMGALGDLIPTAKAKNVTVIAMKPVAGGAIINVKNALRFSLLNGADVVIPGMESTQQVKENAEAGSIIEPLDKDELFTIDEEVKKWTGTFCRRCGYCLPCENGLDIPSLFLLEAYYSRYGMRDWSKKRLKTLDKKYADCTNCKTCIEKCPYDLDIPKMMRKAAKTVI